MTTERTEVNNDDVYIKASTILLNGINIVLLK